MTSLNSIINYGEDSQMLGPIWPFLGAWITIGELLPLFVIILGLFTLSLPGIRAKYIANKYKLEEIESYEIASLTEIHAYINQIAPSLLVKVNLVRTDHIAFVYPLGFRNTALAVFGGLIRLWKSDREVAEAIIRHEIGHCRQGDPLILGVGSFFGYIINNWVKITLIFVLIPVILLPIANIFVQGVGTALIMPVILSIPGFILIYSSELLSFLVLPIMAIWCSEINADRYMAQTSSVKSSLKVVDGLSENRSILKNLLIDPTHPTKNMRKKLISASHSTHGLIFSILLFPMGFVVRFILLEIWSMVSYLMDFSLGSRELDSIPANLISNYVIYFGETMPMTWIFLALMITAWPFIENRWYGFFSGVDESRKRPNLIIYILSSFIIISLSVLTYLSSNSFK